VFQVSVKMLELQCNVWTV